MSARNWESVFVELPTPRTTWTVESTDEFTGSGEEDTHATTLSGVPPLTWWQQPLISDEDKKKVIGVTPSSTVQKPHYKIFDATVGQPLFWNERMPMPYWSNVLKRFKIKKVINFSPGCGMLERVCLEQSIPCVSVCKNQTHQAWMLNVLDRAVTAAMVTKGTSVYDEEIKKEVERFFKDIIDRVYAQDSDEQEMPLNDDIDDEQQNKTVTTSPS